MKCRLLRSCASASTRSVASLWATNCTGASLYERGSADMASLPDFCITARGITKFSCLYEAAFHRSLAMASYHFAQAHIAKNLRLLRSRSHGLGRLSPRDGKALRALSFPCQSAGGVANGPAWAALTNHRPRTTERDSRPSLFTGTGPRCC